MRRTGDRMGVRRDVSGTGLALSVLIVALCGHVAQADDAGVTGTTIEVAFPSADTEYASLSRYDCTNNATFDFEFAYDSISGQQAEFLLSLTSDCTTPSGGFNVPFGRSKNPLICDADNLRACSNALRGVPIQVTPFDAVFAHAKRGDFVSFDPPYIPLTKTAAFTSYLSGGFSLAHQEHLARVMVALNVRGVHVLCSNSDTLLTRKVFDLPGFEVVSIRAPRSMAANGKKRGKVGELLIKTTGRTR